MNLKENGAKLEGYDEQFLKTLLSHHEKHDDKMKDFEHFSVDNHPDYPNTRCFFVVRKDGSKEDFSMSRCVQNMENKGKAELEAKKAAKKATEEAAKPEEKAAE